MMILRRKGKANKNNDDAVVVLAMIVAVVLVPIGYLRRALYVM